MFLCKEFFNLIGSRPLQIQFTSKQCINSNINIPAGNRLCMQWYAFIRFIASLSFECYQVCKEIADKRPLSKLRFKAYKVRDMIGMEKVGMN